MDAQEMVAAMRRKSAERIEAKQAAREAQAAENRRRMPTVTQWVDGMREEFGDVRVVWASEGGVTIGSPSPAGVKLSETLVGPWNTKKDPKKS